MLIRKPLKKQKDSKDSFVSSVMLSRAVSVSLWLNVTVLDSSLIKYDQGLVAAPGISERVEAVLDWAGHGSLTNITVHEPLSPAMTSDGPRGPARDIIMSWGGYFICEIKTFVIISISADTSPAMDGDYQSELKLTRCHSAIKTQLL